MSSQISLKRIFAVVAKEAIQMRRDRLTFAMIAIVPLMQLFLFGFAINSDPKHLPAAVTISDPGVLADSIVAALAHSGYYDIRLATNSPAQAHRLLGEGKVSFVVEIPENFSRDIVRGLSPTLLVEADASDPASSSNAIGALSRIVQNALRDDLKGPLAMRVQGPPPFQTIVHPLYNPEGITQYNIVPGLLGIILTMSMVLSRA